jgi:protein-S-isoprenylcysteine O-methyltransferase Ste14
MTRLHALHILAWIWAAFGVCWFASARRATSARTQESRVYRLVRLLILALVFILLFADWAGVGPLAWPFVRERAAVIYSGFVLALLGLALAMWARIHLGQYWSDRVVLKVDHQLVRTGPYAWIRHPIYSGVLLGVAGTAVVLGEWRGVLAFVILLVNYCIKAGREDRLLAEAFPDQFAEHKSHAGFLLPNFIRK